MTRAISGALSLVLLILVLKMFFPEVTGELGEIIAKLAHLALVLLNLAIANLPATA